MTTPFDAPRDDLVRHVPFTLDRAGSGDGLTLTGHGAVFNEWTTIDSWEGRFKERVAPGAFKKTLQESGNRVRLQFDHGQPPLIGSLPIGAIRKLREDDVGLFVEARLADNWLVQPVRDAIDNGSVDGMSFRFSVEKEEWAGMDSDLPERTITEVRLMELGPVVFPAYEQTDVGVRSLELARSLRNTDEDTRREIARLLIAPDTPDVEAAEGTSAEEPSPETEPHRSDEAADGTSDDATHSGTYIPASRPVLTDEKRRAQLAEVASVLDACA
jgi:HK97 family phage prohead protease